MKYKDRYTACRLSEGRIVVKMPGTEYALSDAEARKLCSSVRSALNEQPERKTPIWLLELGGLARATRPLFWGLLEEENGEPRWKQDETLVDWMAKGWVEIVGTTLSGGFVITDLGREAYEREWAKYEKAK